MLINLKTNKGNTILEIVDSNNIIIRKVKLIIDKEYVINPLNQRNRNRGRKVILKKIFQDEKGSHAKVKYLDSSRPGKVDIGDLDEFDKLSLVDLYDDYIDKTISRMEPYLKNLSLFLKVT
ncbi:hypothetical protein [Oceanobacillus kimchii]|uniref:Uncharacterized protein n=1 Tax=Oceanobacillus kimchii TaxID=746691 RepID=A0ABQ5TNJ2_9BACI|nr:hypothetical protein [Oceanobacillus kimchii]GLO68378.1 hypothetical protein MACH08_41620 [Oceanobacillus kimchii]